MSGSILFAMAAEQEYGPALRARIKPVMVGVGPVEAAVNLTAEQRRQLFGSENSYWSSRREEIYSALGKTLYDSLKKKYGG